MYAKLVITMVGAAVSVAAQGQTVTDFYPQSGGIGSTVTFHVDNPRTHGMTAPATPDKMRLFVNGRVISDVPPVVDLVNNRLIFDLKYNDNSAPAWRGAIGFGRDVQLSVGIPDKGPLPLDSTVKGRVFRMEPSPLRLTVSGLLLAVLLLAFLLLATRSNILRNAELAATTPGAKPYAFSLARTQMAFWTFLTLAAAILIWLLTNRFTVSGDMLVLLGIAVATGLGAVMVDGAKQASAAAGAVQASAEAAKTLAAANALAPLEPAPLALQSLAADQAAKAGVLAADSRPPNTTGNFLRDVLSDENGVSLHRFQIFAWTLVLGIYFIFEVFATFSWPVFSNELLVLMGISNSTYIGFKFPERRS